MAKTAGKNRLSYVDQNECTGCEACAVLVPEVFRMTTTALSEVYDPQGASEKKIQEAMDGCPVSCIHWKD